MTTYTQGTLLIWLGFALMIVALLMSAWKS